jgi:hypothetical protein
MEVETGREAGVIHGPLGDTVDLPVVGTALSGWSPPRHPPAFLRQASSSSLQFQHVPVALSLSSLLAYIKHLAVSSRRALKAGWPRSEVTIQESCILKGFCKKSWVSSGSI